MAIEKQNRLDEECEKLDIKKEQALAELELVEVLKRWPDY